MQTNKDILHELDTWHHNYTKIQHHLQEKIQELRTTIKNQNDNIHTLQQKLRDYKQKENFKTKYAEVQEHLDKEKERLEKLYHKYWETENECQLLRDEVNQWHDWFDQNRQNFEKVFTAAPQRLKNNEIYYHKQQLPHLHDTNTSEKTTTKSTSTPKSPQEPLSKRKRTRSSPRRRLRLRK